MSCFRGQGFFTTSWNLLFLTMMFIQENDSLIAAGFVGCEEYTAKDFGVKLTDRGVVETLLPNYRTNVDKVFTAGDMHRGQSLVVWAIAEGRECAREIDEYLMGYSNM